MAMHPCDKCLNNKWKFETKRELHADGLNYDKWCLAECEVCGNEVEFGHKTLSTKTKYGTDRVKNFN